MIFHIARARDWQAARRAGEYRMSTEGRSLDDEGFVHCSADRAQVLTVAAAVYGDVRDDLVLLSVDETELGCPLRLEAVGPTGERFPHVFGPIPTHAVVRVALFVRGTGGEFVWPE